MFLFLLLILLAVMILVGSVVAQIALVFSVPSVMPLLILVVLVSLVLLLGAVFNAYTVLFFWTYRLEFGESVLRMQASYHPFLPPFRCAYDDVVRVRRGVVRGLLEIVPREGKPLRVGVRAFGGRDRLVGELSKRLDAARIEADLETSLWKYTWFDRFNIAVLILFILSQVVYWYLSIGHDFVLASVAWKSAWGRALATSVEAFSLDSDDTVWIMTETGLGNDCRVQHVTNSGTRTWDVPDGMGRLPGCGVPIGLARDDAGRPVVVYEDQLLHWDGEAWQHEIFAPVENGLRVNSGWVASRGIRLWGTAETANGSGSVLFGLDLSSGEFRVVPPPASAVNDGLAMSYRFRQSVDGSLLVLMTGGSQVRLYLLRDGEWLEPGCTVFTPSPARVSSFAVDSAGRIWLLLDAEPGKYDLGRFDPETATWDWSEFESGQDFYRDYESIEVDERGRVWLSGSAYRRRGANVGIFEGLVLDVFELTADGQAHQLVCYTPDNSNYQGGHSMSFSGVRLGGGGRLWAADDRLVWLDTTARELPSPLPDWILPLTGTEARLILLLGTLVAMGMYAGVYALACRAGRSRDRSADVRGVLWKSS
ncbi:MAG: hypothetical protein JW918_04515 [Anaerolineae bacterium]|nr:hypothetical protein [Anaerolineae bacterium]